MLLWYSCFLNSLSASVQQFTFSTVLLLSEYRPNDTAGSSSFFLPRPNSLSNTIVQCFVSSPRSYPLINHSNLADLGIPCSKKADNCIIHNSIFAQILTRYMKF